MGIVAIRKIDGTIGMETVEKYVLRHGALLAAFGPGQVQCAATVLRASASIGAVRVRVTVA